jgi:predicted amidophosphoribosyltransferase
MKDSSKMLNFNLNRTLAFESDRRIGFSPDRELLFSSSRELLFDLDRELDIRSRGVVFRGYICSGCRADVSRDAEVCNGCGAVLEQVSDEVLNFDHKRNLLFDPERDVGFDSDRDLIFDSERELSFDMSRVLKIRKRGVVFRGRRCPKCGAPTFPEAFVCDECGARLKKKKKETKAAKKKMVWERGKKVPEPQKEIREKAKPPKPEVQAQRETFYCPLCGKLLYVGSNFCTNCGTMFGTVAYRDQEPRDGRRGYTDYEWASQKDERETRGEEDVPREKESTMISWDEYRRRGRRDGIVSWDEYYKRKKRS